MMNDWVFTNIMHVDLSLMHSTELSERGYKHSPILLLSGQHRQSTYHLLILSFIDCISIYYKPALMHTR